MVTWKSGLCVALLVSAVVGFAAAPPAALKVRENEYYRMVTLPMPAGVQFESGSLDFIEPDTLVCGTRIGEIWTATDTLKEPASPKWTLFERGLHEVLGLTHKDGWIYAQQFCELSRLRDTNGDGRADVVEAVSTAWSVNGDYHEYAFGSKFDRDGNIWTVLCLTGSFSSDGPWRGWAMRTTPEGKTIPTCSGIRSPGGIGFNAAGDCFYTDNQGPWNGACKLQWLKPGAYVGHPDGLRWFDDPRTKAVVEAAGLRKPAKQKSGGRLATEAGRIPELLPPAVYFPYKKMGQSAAGIVTIPVAGFGPFGGQLLVADQMQSTVMRVTLEKTADNYQGACYPFRSGFDSGSLALQFAPDGSLFVFQTDRGWAAIGGKPFALQRLVWTGRTPFEVLAMTVTAEGFRLTFTEPVDLRSAADPKSYDMSAYTYIFQSSYGSPEVDVTSPRITSARVSEDGRTVDLVVDGRVLGHVHELHLTGVRSAGDARPLLHPEAYYTLNSLPGD
ncbi:MAG: hypothetical protein K1X57_16065 [Gemmataceae bacterium]|nr:hypothetical protein [Gemmataceae bacterium]